MDWDEIEPQAARIFNIWTSEGDLHFAKETWGHLASAGLADDDGPVVYTLSLLRLLVLRQICGEFSREKWDEGADDDLADCASELDFDQLALGVIAGEHMKGDALLYHDEYDLKCAAIAVACDAVRAEVVDCLRKAYGGSGGVYARLSRIAGDDDGGGPDDYNATANNLAAFNYSEDL
ncbi:hypothetical protein K9U39_14270 [Rhodoblastus acidophilus]|uniref:Uncharacterized protein n=1 Tax=Candidatus Rhodoblastus alkanivorans TaxID=2954117 RepID=A0ABS9ZAX5_9HYPH|nr:hypothetical protein [Candidatus Rhodoblastus alkanivorans]MCI4677734.1 hypothetical protein [Candidatus Rhodoblastus alkanivorans]MCI4684768.1 hypothetical protein [Candidatus Rhodoblastus alkanivorans]MDI4642092.1 hypothetical protein [Rhodoblastus acidophilus]